MSEERTPDVIGVRTSLPAPGWTVLDAAREQRFTGEVVAHTDVDVEYRIYFDRGEAYVAERATDPSLGTRLVDAGAINNAQLEYGMLRIGEIEHLGRLFDRVPSINRDAVLVLNQLMTEETVRSLASRLVTEVDATPYRHHVSGMHRWTTVDLSGTPPPWGDVPELALPAPPPDARPLVDVDVDDGAGVTPTDAAAPAAPAPPPPPTTPSPTPKPSGTAASALANDDPFLDDVVEWDEPSVFAGSPPIPGRRREPTTTSGGLGTTDWVDELGPDGVGDAPATPAVHAKLPPVAVPPVEQFEIIWPSGETVDVTSTTEQSDQSDISDEAPAVEPDAVPDLERRVTPDAAEDPAVDDASSDHDDHALDHIDGDPTPADALAMRRAVATIDTGSLAVRRRLAAPVDDRPTPPGRLIVGRDHHQPWRTTAERPTGSVFDAQPATPDEPTGSEPSADDDQSHRAGALKRLIESLRKN